MPGNFLGAGDMAVKKNKDSALKVCTFIYIYIWIYNIYQTYTNEYIMKLQVLISAMRKNEGGMVLFDLG